MSSSLITCLVNKNPNQILLRAVKDALKLINQSKPEQKPVALLKYCDTFFKKGLGLMFSKDLDPNEGIILVESKESRINTAIHMLFMNFNITVLWLDKNMVVVEKVLAKKWRPIYYPEKPAQYVVELHHNKFDKYAVGDKLILTN